MTETHIQPIHLGYIRSAYHWDRWHQIYICLFEWEGRRYALPGFRRWHHIVQARGGIAKKTRGSKLYNVDLMINEACRANQSNTVTPVWRGWRNHPKSGLQFIGINPHFVVDEAFLEEEDARYHAGLYSHRRGDKMPRPPSGLIV